MKVEVQDVSASQKRIEVQIPADRVNDEIEEQFVELQKKAQVKGFRPGKAPRKLVERMFKKYVYAEVAEKLIKESMEPAFARKNIEPLVDPVVDPSELEADKDYAYTIHVEVKPEIELAEYKGIDVVHKDEDVDEETVEKSLEALRENAAMLKAPEEPRPIKKGDEVLAEFKILEGDETLYEEAEESLPLYRETWIPGMTEKLEGRSEGDEIEYSAAVAEDDEKAPSQFKGKTLKFTVKVKGIMERILPELNDDFAKEYSRSDTLEDLKDAIRERLIEQVTYENKNRLEYSIMEALVGLNDFEVPPTVVKREAARMAENFVERATGRKADAAGVERFIPLFEEEAKKGVKANFILEAISNKEEIEASDEDVDNKLKEEAERMNMHPDKLRDRFEEAGMDVLKGQIVLEKTLDFLASHANIKDEAPKEDKSEKEGGAAESE